MNTSLPNPPIEPEHPDSQEKLDLPDDADDDSDLPEDEAQPEELAELEPEEPVGTPASNQRES
ncbi:hypothetical protein [Achromobacter marplatensis]|jgi:hypothetical protein|uniref:Uncharacterized protein n=1 Tax=Achromobacter marplatensis TaxID=470868 RepID=A0AA42WBK6_9BURK|nr:hypothetical protein [Achromobacter marplatensis]EJO28743.1 hypothetical protein QWC_25177 [Achromobacter marplatensis]MDH2052289.1 hypothetical protein [Achromobacter marplatensis]